MSYAFVGLDIETTGLGDDCATIELGMAYMTIGSGLEFFSELVCPQRRFAVEPEAMAVNGIDLGAVVRKAGSPSIVEAQALRWLDGQFPSTTTLMPAGFNVGSFDIQFLKREMPLLAARFSHRHVELNSAILAATGFSTLDFEQNKLALVEAIGEWRDKHGVVPSTPHRALSDAVDAAIAVHLIGEGWGR